MRRLFTALAASAILLMPFTASAMSAEELNNLSSEAQTAFFAGAIGMAMLSGTPQRAQCIADWYFKSGTAPGEIAQVFEMYKNKPAAGLLKVLIDRKCGKLTTQP